MHFFSFPAEIRLQIYSDVLVQDDAVKLRFGIYHGERRVIQESKRGGAALLCASMTVNAEAAPILYSHNRFEFGDVNSWPLETIGAIARLVRHIRFANMLRIETDPESVRAVRMIQATCSRLRTIEILSNDMPSLEKIVVRYSISSSKFAHWSPEWLGTIDRRGPATTITWSSDYDRMVQRLPGAKWTIEFVDLSDPMSDRRRPGLA
ncbi:hypothetical protein B0T26DRAFT_755507 [Lasiosphaeria miniovina]|uniref:F-box domain-containing protein n=1 Tax=Lasiosphaeria miniovina TaxID=1954250 RepID=A0AA39ZYE4_9PEZI|nr:uncharacterized protein B0T26DRAFT_755507 [Lasiosphaeria miniovina]KAK0705947.1 hypothetical protein B0T26DRAFT_755507 [Lasiosphaeria miniovina]